MRILLARLLGLGGVGLIAACGADDRSVTGDDDEIKVSASQQERTALVRSAEVWDKAEFDKLASKNLRAGVAAPGMPEPGGEIVCKFIDPQDKNEFSGKTEKFNCGPCELTPQELAAGKKPCTVKKKTKIKYAGKGHPTREFTPQRLVEWGQQDARASNSGEVASEVIGTRLMWALGFYADRMYPARVLCYGCPEDPWPVYQRFPSPDAGGPRDDRWFAYAAAEIKHPGEKVEVTADQGWDWNEHTLISEAEGGAPREQVDALRLLGAFMQHGDNKPDNQRLLCLDEGVTPDGKCKPGFARVMIQDIGAGFGAPGFLGIGIKKADLGAWQGERLWQDLRSCTANLDTTKPERTLKDPKVTESARAFLSGLMDRLTDEQLRTIFEIARVSERGDSIDDWMRVFNEKRAALRQRCGG
jgi:hypothetical protein